MATSVVNNSDQHERRGEAMWLPPFLDAYFVLFLI